jgi:hypothetical protein
MGRRLTAGRMTERADSLGIEPSRERRHRLTGVVDLRQFVDHEPDVVGPLLKSILACLLRRRQPCDRAVQHGLDWLERAVRQGDDRADWFERNPALANFRGEPRFRQIHDSLKARLARPRSPDT